MAPHSRKPILVTGSHRSGSTWVGKMLAASPEVAYIHEPFHIERRITQQAPYFELWLTYVCDENAVRWEADLRNLLGFRFNVGRELKAIRRPRQVASMFKRWGQALSNRCRGRRALMKDPIAIFSVEWLAKTFDMDILVIARHPAAFVGSVKAANWPHPFDHFVRQPLLMEHHLAPFRSQIEEQARDPKDIIDNAILSWNLIHHMVRKYRTAHPEWTFVRHEDLSVDTVPNFRKIYERFGLAFTPKIEEVIRTSSQSENPNPGTHDTKRDSKANLFSWQKRLTDDEIARIKAGTREIADEFYTAADWGGK